MLQSAYFCLGTRALATWRDMTTCTFSWLARLSKHSKSIGLVQQLREMKRRSAWAVKIKRIFSCFRFDSMRVLMSHGLVYQRPKCSLLKRGRKGGWEGNELVWRLTKPVLYWYWALTFLNSSPAPLPASVGILSRTWIKIFKWVSILVGRESGFLRNARATKWFWMLKKQVLYCYWVLTFWILRPPAPMLERETRISKGLPWR